MSDLGSRTQTQVTDLWCGLCRSIWGMWSQMSCLTEACLLLGDTGTERTAQEHTPPNHRRYTPVSKYTRTEQWNSLRQKLPLTSPQHLCLQLHEGPPHQLLTVHLSEYPSQGDTLNNKSTSLKLQFTGQKQMYTSKDTNRKKKPL